jgi:hypothetical protein
MSHCAVDYFSWVMRGGGCPDLRLDRACARKTSLQNKQFRQAQNILSQVHTMA